MCSFFLQLGTDFLFACVCCGKVAQVINRAATGKVSPVAMVSFHRKVLDAQNVDQRGKTK